LGRSWPSEGAAYASHYEGEAQIVDSTGGILARMSQEDREGVISGDVSFGPVAQEVEAIPDRFWIADIPESVDRGWQSALTIGHDYYTSTTLPYVKERFDHPLE